MNSFDAGVYDIYDDGGLLLKRVVPDPEDIPDFVKTAAQLSPDDDNRLYALVMINEGQVMKKFATADPGNTWLSVLYFGLTRENLPEGAQKVAAANLIEACDAFDIEAPEMLWDVADGPAEGNVIDVTGQRPPAKIASADDREDVEYAIERADGSTYYPLRDAKDVTTAMDYFDRHAGDFVPRERREFAVKVASVARRGALPLTEKIAKYSGQDWNPAVEGHLTTRYMHLTERDAPIEVKERLIKIAKLRSEIGPDDFANVLEQFDIDEGLDALWDRSVADPWYSTCGMSKIAKGSAEPPETFTEGDATVTQEELELLAERAIQTVSNTMGDAFARAFQRNPVTQFKALPAPQRRLLARMASSAFDETSAGVG